MEKIPAPKQSAEDWWQFLAEPEKQWRSGYSARTVAYCAQAAGHYGRFVELLGADTKLNGLSAIYREYGPTLHLELGRGDARLLKA